MRIRIIEPIGMDLSAIADVLARHDVEAFDSRGWNDERLVAECSGAQVILMTNRPISGAVIEALPSLRLISVAFAGIDSIDAAAATRANVRIDQAQGYANTAVAELAIGLLVCLARGIPAHDRAIRAGGTASVGSELRGKTLGIVGAGAIGREVIRLGEAFGMRAIHHDRGSGTPLPELFAESDFVSVHVPLTDETRGMIDRSLLSAMKPTAFLVNTARGPVVDHDNLVTALREGWIAGAALDVFTTEPPIPSDEPLLGFANVIATPHIGFDTAEAVKAKAQLAVQHVVDFTADP